LFIAHILPPALEAGEWRRKIIGRNRLSALSGGVQHVKARAMSLYIIF